MTTKLEWYNIELSKKEFQVLRVLLKTNNIYYEPSSCFNQVYVAIQCNENDMKLIDFFIKKLVELQKRG